MEVIQQQDLQQVAAEGEAVMPCTAPDPSLEAKPDSSAVETAITGACDAPIEPAADAVTEEAKPSDEPTSIEVDATVETKQEEMQQPAEENATDSEKQAPSAEVSEETPNEGDSSLEEVAIIKQKRKFDAIQDEASAAEENVAKKIKFEE